MNSKKNKINLGKILEGIDLEKVVKESLKNSAPKLMHESYISEPKSFSQVSEFVSLKTKESHYQIYNGYVDSLNRVSSELDTVPRGTDKVNSYHSEFRSLKLDESYNLNAKWLHELYFANCFDPHSELYMESLAYMRLARDFGTFEDWQKDLMACALSCGNGYAVCGYSLHLQRYVNTVVSNYSQDVMMGINPIVVLDMWEHSYTRDYNTDKRSYLIAMMRELNWNVIEERVQRSEQMAEVVK